MRLLCPVSSVMSSGQQHMSQNNSLPWSEVVRQAVQADGRTQAELAALAGITQAQISRFLAGKRLLMLDAAGKLAEAVGLMVVRRP